MIDLVQELLHLRRKAVPTAPATDSFADLVRALEKRAAVATVADSIAHRLANPVAVSVIQSIQYGTVSVNSATSGTATITAVNLAKAVLISLGDQSNKSSTDYAAADRHRLALTNSTTVTASRNIADTHNVTVGFVVVEFK